MAAVSQPSLGVPVADGIGRLPGFVNSYTYRDNQEIFLIDTGFSRKAKPIVRAFQSSNTPLDRVSKVLLTHHHGDHMGGAAYLMRSVHGPLACHAEDAPFVDGRQKPPMSFLMRLLMRTHTTAVGLLLKDGDQVGDLRVIFAPGHTPGEVTFYHPARKILFSGDAICESKGKLVLPAARFASNLNQAIDSLKKFQGLGVQLLLPGHGEPVRADFPSLLDDLIRRAPREYMRA